MSEVKLVLRDASKTRSGTIHGSVADACVAALAAGPVTVEELDVALERFRKRDGERSFFGWFHTTAAAGGDYAPWDAGLVVIDLAAKLVVYESSYSSPHTEGGVTYHNGHCGTRTWCRYKLSMDWRIERGDWEQWQHLAEQRRAEFTALPPLDMRAIVFGRPLIEFLVTECSQQFARRDEILAEAREKWIVEKREWIEKHATEPQSDPASLTIEELAPKTWPGQEQYASPFYDTLKDIHARWLMTPREDLRGRSPREWLLADREHLSWDAQYRCEQWSELGHCPRGLDDTSHAFRFGGFGTHELVVYYYLVRHLLWSCWDALDGSTSSQPQGAGPTSPTHQKVSRGGSFLSGVFEVGFP